MTVAPGAKRTFRFPWRTRTAIRAEVREEFQFHIDMRAAELVESGLDEAGARAQALREFGDQASGAEACVRVDTQVERRVRITTIVGDFWRDTVLGLRLLLRSPGFSVVAIGTLAAAIALGTAAKSLLFGLDGFDPLVLSASIVLLALVALSASLVPAMRASRIDPMRALRWD